MLNANDIKNLQIFMHRVDLKGNESMAHAEILIKLANMAQAMAEEQGGQTTTPPETPPDEE